MLKFYLELALDSQLGLGGIVDGRVQFSRLRAIKRQPGEGKNADPESSSSLGEGECRIDDGVQFLTYMPTMERFEFLGQICCDLCTNDPNCLYGIASGRDCYIASELDPDYVSLAPDFLGKSYYLS